jgi:hypothetical protein
MAAVPFQVRKGPKLFHKGVGASTRAGAAPASVLDQVLGKDPCFDPDAGDMGMCFLSGMHRDRLAMGSFARSTSRFVRNRGASEAKAVVRWLGKVQTRMRDLGLFCPLTPSGVCEVHTCQAKILALGKQRLSRHTVKTNNMLQVLTCSHFREEVVAMTRELTEEAICGRQGAVTDTIPRLPYSKRSIVARNVFLSHVRACGLGTTCSA